MKILLAFATAGGATAQAATIAAQKLTELSHEVTLKDIRSVESDDLKDFAVIIFASPTWWARNQDGMPHEFFLSFMDKVQNKTFEKKSFAVFGLGDTSYPNFCSAVEKIEEFITQIHGELIIASLRLDSFTFDLPKNTHLLDEWLKNLSSEITSKV